MNANAKMDQLYIEAQKEIKDEVYLRTQILYCRKLEKMIRDLSTDIESLKRQQQFMAPVSDGPTVTPEKFVDVLNDPRLLGGKKIQMILAVRSMFGYGLKEAKDLVEKVTHGEELPF